MMTAAMIKTELRAIGRMLSMVAQALLIAALIGGPLMYFLLFVMKPPHY